MRKKQKAPVAFDARRRTKFLKHYSKTGRKLESCEMAGISGTCMRTTRNGDEDFAAAMDDALARFGEMLEEAAVKRATAGIPRLVVQKGEVVMHDGRPLEEYQFSDSLLSQQLKAALPQKYRENSTIQHEGESGVLVVHAKTPEEVTANLEALRQASLEE